MQLAGTSRALVGCGRADRLHVESIRDRSHSGSGEEPRRWTPRVRSRAGSPCSRTATVPPPRPSGRPTSTASSPWRATGSAAPRRAADEEDVALAAFDSFYRRAERGKFPEAQGPRRPLAAAVRPDRAQGHRPGPPRGPPARPRRPGAGALGAGRAGRRAAARHGAHPRVRRPGGRRVPAAARPPGGRVAARWRSGRWRARPTPRSPRGWACVVSTVERKLERIRDLWAREGVS